MNKEKCYKILSRLRESNPYPTIELDFNSCFELLISLILSARSTDVTVNKVTAKLYAVANTPAKMLEIGAKGIKSYIKTIGLSNKKAENIIKTCHILLEKYQGMIPENRVALEELPGVGRKITNVILNTAFGWPTIAVDTHVFRVCNRTDLAYGKNVKQVEKKLLKVVPKEFVFNCHNWLVLHGRYTCLPRKPHCTSCLIKDLCKEGRLQ